MSWPLILENARIRAQPEQLQQDCAAAIEKWLRGIAGTTGRSDAALAGWVLTKNDAGLRDRWARRLEDVVGEAVGPVWSRMNAAIEADNASDDLDKSAFRDFAFEGPALVASVLSSPHVRSDFADMARARMKESAHELTNEDEYPPDTYGDDIELMPCWEWLGGYVASPRWEKDRKGWVVVARIEGGVSDRGDGVFEKPPPFYIHRPAEPAQYLMVFAASLWESEWRAVARRAYELSTRENALTVRTVEGVVGLLSSATIAHDNGETLALIDPDGERRGEIDLLSLQDLLQRSNSGGGVVTPEVVRATAEELIRARHTVAGVHAFTHAVQTVTTLVRGGHPLTSSWPKWKEWAEAVSDHAEVRLTPDLRRALYSVAWFGNLAQMRLFDGRFQRGFWTLSAPDPFQRGRRRRGESQVVDFSYSPVLSPEWACRENPGDRSRGVRLLYIPPRLPVGSRINPNQKAQAQLFTLLLLSRIAKHTDSRRVADGAVLTPDDLSQLARLAGLNLAYIDRQIDAMQDAGLIEQVTPTRFSLAGDKARQLAAYRKKPPRRRSRKGR